MYSIKIVRDWWNTPLSRDYYNLVSPTGKVIKTYKRLTAARQRACVLNNGKEAIITRGI